MSKIFQVKLNGRVRGTRASKKAATELGFRLQKNAPNSTLEIMSVSERPAKKKSKPVKMIKVRYMVIDGRVVEIRS